HNRISFAQLHQYDQNGHVLIQWPVALIVKSQSFDVIFHLQRLDRILNNLFGHYIINNNLFVIVQAVFVSIPLTVPPKMYLCLFYHIYDNRFYLSDILEESLDE